MAKSRFFVPGQYRCGDTVTLPEAQSHHASRVLRMRTGDRGVIFPGTGPEFEGAFDFSGGVTRITLDTETADSRQSPLAATLVQALVSMDKMDWIIEKATEIGARRIIVTAAERSSVRMPPAKTERKVAGWQATAVSACCQCGLNVVPEILWIPKLADALAAAGEADLKAVLAPGAEKPASLAGLTSAIFAVGPEGGFSPAEIKAAESLGFQPMLLGPRVLRTETAGLAVLAAAQAFSGDYGISR